MPGILRTTLYISIIFLSSCSGYSVRQEALQLNAAINKDLVVYNTDSALARAYRLKSMTSLSFCRKEHIASIIYIGESHFINGNSDSAAFYLSKADTLAEKYSDWFALGIIYNSYGVDCCKKAEFGKAVRYFFKALTYARKSRNDQLSATVKYNLAMMYYLRQDPDGLSFALDIYNNGVTEKDSSMLYLGALRASYMYWFLNRPDSAAWYARKALPLAAGREEEYNLYTLYGDILLHLGENDEAAGMYSKVIGSNAFKKGQAGTDIYLSYGRFLRQQGDYEGALSILSEGMTVADTSFNNVNSHLMYREASQICSLVNDMDGYRRYRSLYDEHNDAIFNYRKERDISDSELEIAREEYELSIRSANRKTAFLVTLLTVFTAAVGITVFSIHRSRVRKQKARQDRAAADYAAIFQKLESLMAESRIYRDRNITREAIAERLATNKTYVTRAVHDSTGMNLAAYINSYRIKEAVSILSDPDDSRPIKDIVSFLGFSSLSNFYKLFSEATGISPSQFRKQNS